MSGDGSIMLAKVHVGRIYPFNYRQQEAEEALAGLLRTYGGEIIWLLDIRFDPDGSLDGFQGSWLKKVRPGQYRHAKGLGLTNSQLYYPTSAVRKILELLQAGESFVLFSNSAEHVGMVETLVRGEAQKCGIVLEDPYALSAGDLCLWDERETGKPVEVVLHHRTPDVYTFLAGFLQSLRSEYVDIRDLKVAEALKYRCDTCGKGEAAVTWREQPQQKLCRHCFWVWDLEYGEE